MQKIFSCKFLKMWFAKLSVILLPLFYLLMLLILLLLFLFFLPLLLIKRFVSLFGKIFGGPSLRKILSASATNHASIRGQGTSLVPFILKGIPNLEHIKSEFTNKVLNAKDFEGQLLYPELRQTVVSWGGYLFWKNVQNFQIPIRLLDISEPVDLVSPAGIRLLRSLYGKDWKLVEEPLWELIIVPGVDDSFGLVFTFDHTLCDALAMQKLLDKLCNPSIRISKRKLQKSGPSKLLLLICTMIRIPYDVVLALRAFWRTTLFASNITCQNKNSENRSIPDSCLTLVSTTFNLPDLKKIARAHDVSLNTLLISSIQKSIQTVWNDDRKGSNLLFFPTPDPSHPEKLRNLGGMGYVELFQGPGEAGEKLHQIEDQLQGFKSSTFPLLVNIFGRLSGSLPPFLLRRTINCASGNLKTLVFSTFVASKSPTSICSYPVVRMGSVGSGHSGTRVVSFFAFSWEDLMSFTVMGDQRLISEEDGNAILKIVRDEFETHQKTVEMKSTDHINIIIQDVQQF